MASKVHFKKEVTRCIGPCRQLAFLSLLKMKITVFLVAIACLTRSSLGQGTTQFTFDGPPVVAPGTGIGVTNYYESGMSFRPAPGSLTFSRWGPATDPRDPNNGT